MPRDKYAKDRKKIETSIATKNFGSHMGYLGASKQIEASKKSLKNEDTRSANIIKYYQGGTSDTTKIEPKQTVTANNLNLKIEKEKLFENYKKTIKDSAKKKNGKN